MANSYVRYTGDGVTTNRAVPFPYISQDHVSVTVDGVSTAFTWVNASTVSISPAPANGADIKVSRDSSSTERLVEYQVGTLNADDLNTDSLQAFYLAQEAVDRAGDAMGLTDDGDWDAEGLRVTNAGDAVDAQDLVTKAQLDAAAIAPVTPTAGSIANVPSGNLAGTTVQAALNELQGDVDTLTTSVAAKANTASPTFTGTPAVPTAAAKTSTTQAASTAFVTAAIVGVGSTSGLKIVRNATTSIADITADEAVLVDSSGQIIRHTAVSVSPNINTSGSAINARDQAGAFSTSTTVYLWLISDGTTIAGLASLSATAPTLPSGYTYKLLVGAWKTTSGSGTVLQAATQRGKTLRLDVGVKDVSAATCPTSGSATASTMSTVPTIATKALFLLWNNTGGQYYKVNHAAFTVVAHASLAGSAVELGSSVVDFPVEVLMATAQTLYWGGDSANATDIWTHGWDIPGNLG